MEEIKFNIIKYPERKDWNRLLKRPVLERENFELIVASVLQGNQTGLMNIG
jgi:hypothetical protein